MSTLPTGTVSLLFSDIEGSTVLLSRLGANYADALDGQRQVLRKAWATHGGTEVGTEGDSFFVVFHTAPAAVAAATQAQRELAIHPWPGGERVRVRVGVHTGSPTVHDDGYVGMDVHRAARIAGAAHGGQVVLSDATALLVRDSLPDGVVLLDLGAHQLKDLPAPERLFQLSGYGLPAKFAPLKTLGASSSLPVPPTVLVGRDGELAELTALLGSSHVRLVTLTGSGGSGKTRLGIGLARRLTRQFPDGVYFVSLAAVTTAEVMWTTIAEELDLPPEGRIPPGFFTHVAHRSALLVLDNLEQFTSADAVVAELLTQAPQVVVIATSRRPLHVPAEHEHAVPPLELPTEEGLDAARRSGAVQLFLQQACKVRSNFKLTADNAADVAAVCRRLDGLPLAVELAAARSKLLSPRALLSRLDKALDMAAGGSQVPSRQKTLRDTIGWSYDLLTPELQVFCRRLGVFSGGADLDAISAVTSNQDEPDSADAFTLVADLVDASLVTVTETPDGEPRIGVLETVRAYALDRLTASGELDAIRERHAHHYLGVAERLRPLMDGEQRLGARPRFEAEHDNFREALGWALQPGRTAAAPVDGAPMGLRLCTALGGLWYYIGYFSEGRRWTERAIEDAGGDDRPELARCLSRLAATLRILGDLDCAYERATSSVDMWRRLNETSRLATALNSLAGIQQDRGQAAAARSLYEEAIDVARESGAKEQLRSVLLHFATLESSEHNYHRSMELDMEAVDLARELGDPFAELNHQHNMACTLRLMGRVEEARRRMRSLIHPFLEFDEPRMLIALAEDYSAVLAELGDYHHAVRLLGAADAMRERLGTPRMPSQQAEIAEPIANSRAAWSTRDWNDAYQVGRQKTVEDALIDVDAMDADAKSTPNG